MAGVDTERIGVCSWSYQRPLREVADEMAKIGVKGIDLALTPFVAPDGRHGVEEGEEALAFAKAQFASGAWRLFATMISFPQEDYSTLDTIRKTGGVVPDDCWPRNREIAAAAAELSGTLGAPYMLFHAGFLDESNPAAYAAYVERVSFVRDACAKAGVQLILESGQETAEDLARFLRDVPEADFRAAVPALREKCGDRAVLRAMHFYADDRRAVQEADALDAGDFSRFLSLVNASGISSELALQNAWSPSNAAQQAIPLTLAVGRELLGGAGAIRVHGGGFAGTIQAFVPMEKLDAFRTGIEALCGAGRCHVTRIRPQGGCLVAE